MIFYLTDQIETKTTIVKNAEPLKLKSNVFAKGFKVEISWNLDPNNPINIDKIMSVQPDGIKFIVDQFIKLNESLGYVHLQDKYDGVSH